MVRNKKFDIPDLEEIIELVKVVEDSGIDELRIEMVDFRLMIGKGTCDENSLRVSEPCEAPGIPDAKKAPVTPSPQESMEPGSKPVKTLEAFGTSEAIDEKLIEIKAPLLGIFYIAPKPGAAPFVEVGSHVNSDDTVCIIEVMKLFNAVKSGVSGRIVKICAENNQMVEYNQTLFWVEPDEPVQP